MIEKTEEFINSMDGFLTEIRKDVKVIGESMVLLTKRMDIASQRLDNIEDHLRMKENFGGAG